MSASHRTLQRYSGGFTLIELAVAMTVIAILGASVLMAVRVQMSQRQSSDTRAALDEARGALLAYASANGQLPCPAQGGAIGQGQEQARNAGQCSGPPRGLLPWEALGIQAIDGWGHRLAYAVTPKFAAINGVTLDTPGSLEIIAGQGGAALASPDAVAAAIWSYGSNGTFGTNPDGSQLPATTSTGADEQLNGDVLKKQVVARDVSENPAVPNGIFDDQVIWISRYVVFGRMIEAGRLP